MRWSERRTVVPSTFLDDFHTFHSRGQSWGVKIKDIGGDVVDVDALCHADKSALEQGINETNTAFAHLTFWPDPSSQNQSGLATDAYIQSQTQQIRIFADTVIRL